MKVTGPQSTIERARTFRQQMTKPERLLWWALRGRRTGFNFRRQHPAGPYVLDFYCDAARLCVEVDGQTHDFTVDADRGRDAWLACQGVRTLRVAAEDVVRDLDGVVQLIIIEASARARY